MKRKGFSFLRSHYEQTKFLTKTQKCSIYDGICEVQFLEKHIDDVSFNDKITQLVWTGIKHSLKTSIEGYCSKMQIDYDKTLGKGFDNNYCKEVDNKEKNKGKNKYKEKKEGEGKSSTLPLILQPELESDTKRVANYLLQNILQNKPNFKQPDIRAWEKDIEKALNDDGRTVEGLIECIDWIYSPSGAFWIPNILSAKKLRDKFDVMESQMMNDPKNKSKVKTALALKAAGYTA